MNDKTHEPQSSKSPKQKITPYLTFPGNAEEAMNFYAHTLPDSKVVSITRITKEERGVVDKILNGILEINGQEFMFMDMEKEFCPAFTWAVSMYYDCNGEAEFDLVFSKLSVGGTVLMGPEAMETKQINIRKAAWVTDTFGVTWQIIWK